MKGRWPTYLVSGVAVLPVAEAETQLATVEPVINECDVRVMCLTDLKQDEDALGPNFDFETASGGTASVYVDYTYYS